MIKLRRIARRISGLIAFLILLLIRLLFTLFPGLFEVFYFDFFFPILRTVQSWLYPLWFLPGYLLLIIFLVALMGFYFLKRRSIKGFFLKFLNLLFWVAAFFLLCFGMQYADKGVAERLELEPAPPIIDLSVIYYRTMEEAMEKRSQIPKIDKVENINQLGYSMDPNSIHQHVKNTLEPVGYKASATGQYVREIPYFLLRKLSISGIYNPFTGESNVEGSLPGLLKYFVMAHEMAHASGITGEGEANFVAWLSLAHSGDPFLEYAAAYFIWRQAAKPLNRKLNSEDLEKLASSIPDELKRDRRAIYEALNREQPWYPEISNKLNDSYLKIQGVESGVEDYDKFLEYYLRYKRSINPSQ